MPCPECGIYGEAPDPGASRWQCAQCGNGFFLRRCSGCARVSYVDGLQGFRSPWSCVWCGQFNMGFSQNKDAAAASVAELAAELARFGPDQPPEAPAAPVPVANAASRQPHRRLRRIVMIATVAAICLVVCVVLVTQGRAAEGRAASQAASQAASGGEPRAATTGTRPVRLTAAHLATAELQGVPGRLSVVGTETGPVTLTGELNWTGRAPIVRTSLDHVTGVLKVTIQCATASPCTGNLRLEVPAGTATIVRQPAGQIVAAGLAGPLCVTAANADISATDLRSPGLMVRLRSGHLDATFATPPRQVTVTLTSAQAALRLPSRVGYRISRQVASGYLGIAIPQASDAHRTVTARLRSSELELLPS